MDKNKCPKIKNQNTFHFLKSPIFSSYVGKKKQPNFRNLKKSPTICSALVFKYPNNIFTKTT